jgi:hypothetical protein
MVWISRIPLVNWLPVRGPCTRIRQGDRGKGNTEIYRHLRITEKCELTTKKCKAVLYERKDCEPSAAVALAVLRRVGARTDTEQSRQHSEC